MCDKEEGEKSETLETISSILPPKSANLVFNDDSERAVAYRKKYIYCISRGFMYTTLRQCVSYTVILKSAC